MKRDLQGWSMHPLYDTWRKMVERCTDSTHFTFKWYGARGITVCDEWLEHPKNFIQDMSPSHATGLTLDRKDNSIGYCKSNCRWSTMREQNKNKTTSIRVVHEGSLIPLIDLARAHGIPYTTIFGRFKRGEDLLVAKGRTPRLSVEINGARRPIARLAEETGVAYATLRKRLITGKKLTDEKWSRNSKLMAEFNGSIQSLRRIAEATNVSYDTLRRRFLAGQPLLKAKPKTQ